MYKEEKWLSMDFFVTHSKEKNISAIAKKCYFFSNALIGRPMSVQPDLRVAYDKRKNRTQPFSLDIFLKSNTLKYECSRSDWGVQKHVIGKFFLLTYYITPGMDRFFAYKICYDFAPVVVPFSRTPHDHTFFLP